MSILYDIIILGAGPAGLSAGLHSAKMGRNVLLIDKGQIGGHLVNMELVTDYPGFPGGISGAELGIRMFEHAAKSGMKSSFGEITAIGSATGECSVTASEVLYRAKALIICTGLAPKKLGIPGEEQLTGMGLSYCAICDAPLYRGSKVAVIGCGEMAVEDTLHLSRFALSVFLICPGSNLVANATHLERLSAKKNVQCFFSSQIELIGKTDKDIALKIKNTETNKVFEMVMDGVFVSLGQEPNTHFMRGFIQLTESNHLITDEWMRAKYPNIFAAGDVRAGSIRSTAAAVGDGACAAFMAEQYLLGLL